MYSFRHRSIMVGKEAERTLRYTGEEGNSLRRLRAELVWINTDPEDRREADMRKIMDLHIDENEVFFPSPKEPRWAAPDFVDSFLSSISHCCLEVDGAQVP